MADAHVWDASSVAALDATTTKYERRGKTVKIVGVNAHSATIHGRLADAAAPARGQPQPRS